MIYIGSLHESLPVSNAHVHCLIQMNLLLIVNARGEQQAGWDD